MIARERGAAAVEAARHGLRVFPVVARGKKPLRRGWQRAATDDVGVVEATWAGVPDANIGVACGGGLLVVDTDSRAGEDAARELGVTDTATVKTGAGRHFYLRGESRNRAGLLPGVDIRGQGGYVVGAGSVHPSGAEYRWEIPLSELPPAPAPPGLLALLAEKPPPRPRSGGLPDKIERGSRNAELFRLACSLRGRSGLSYDELLAAIACANQMRCVPPLDGREVERIARSAAAYSQPPLRATDPLLFATDDALRSRERLLLAALARYANDEGTCWPGVRRLRADTGMASDTIGRAIRALVAADRIVVEKRRGTSNLYRLLDKPESSLRSKEGLRSPRGHDGGSSVLPSRTAARCSHPFAAADADAASRRGSPSTRDPAGGDVMGAAGPTSPHRSAGEQP